MIGILIALLSGALMSIQGVFNTQVTDKTSLWVANGWVQSTALLVCLLAWFVTGRESIEGLMKIQPKYLLAGGIIGAFITLTVVKSMESLGPAKAVMLIVISQLVVAYCIELLGLFGVEKESFEWKKVVAVALSILGFIIFKWNS
ncbi:DMT family transporter [Anaerosacchariphilus polymeriproducens]|uniref:DMT family transporter n=1 Tax=Anaerosacchariphilus polymeriproducens TaxID=1812858 RepID=A0A371AWP1_9FIRM|nr:DMT family transporter [Anaerosacchariphilus polymeriproducens]RDU23987.1 DMT family transporter [Anaerosacchariphilus polymeriproducens]